LLRPASTVRILELVLLRFGDFAFVATVLRDWLYPQTEGGPFAKSGENGYCHPPRSLDGQAKDPLLSLGGSNVPPGDPPHFRLRPWQDNHPWTA